MNGFRSQAEVAIIKKNYPPGTRIELDHMDEAGMPEGLKGIVDFVDDQGQLHMIWENGHSLALIPNEDRFHILPKPEPEESYAEPNIEIER